VVSFDKYPAVSTSSDDRSVLERLSNQAFHQGGDLSVFGRGIPVKTPNFGGGQHARMVCTLLGQYPVIYAKSSVPLLLFGQIGVGENSLIRHGLSSVYADQ